MDLESGEVREGGGGGPERGGRARDDEGLEESSHGGGKGKLGETDIELRVCIVRGNGI